jgi:stage V sporulation protein G
MPKQAPLRQTIGFLSFGIYLYYIAKWRNNKMVVTDIKIRKYFNDGPMKAVVSVTFDSALAVHDIKVINAKDKFFIVMPSRKNPDGTYRDIVHPINSEFRAELEGAVIKAYFDGLENAVFEDAASAEI